MLEIIRLSWIFFFVSFFWPSNVLSSEIKNIGGVEAFVSKPKSGLNGAVIYLHGTKIRKLGYDKASWRGYDLSDFVEAFARKGFVAVAPIRTTDIGTSNGDEALSEVVSSTNKAISFIEKTHPELATRIFLVGFSEGGLGALWALTNNLKVRAAVVASPATMDGSIKKNFSTSKSKNWSEFLAREMARSIKTPVLFTIGSDEWENMQVFVNRLVKQLADSQHPSIKKVYTGHHKMFHVPKKDWIKDIVNFFEVFR
ncbi:MAG: hypothetical protein CMM58_05320 [Rhodospirillaceae bacterium]|nr:hypothetical protein [Rhodospirillaceae bacterium]|tara:strand:- start:1252 stop:2016 length:765 start_codon:yes stop_codon:yes gene_type:complete